MKRTSPDRDAQRHGFRLGRHSRFNACAIVFVAGTVGLFVAGVPAVRAIVLAFVAAAAIFLLLIGIMFAHSRDVAAIRARARQEDQERLNLLWITIGVSAVVLVSLVLELRAGRGGGIAELALAGAALALAWLFMNTMFALHYAHRYYGDDARRRPLGGLAFPGEEDPDYWDFLYFSVVVGMTFQVSDVQVENRSLRRVVLIHGLVAFVFNVVILALSINVIAGKA